LAEVNDNGEVTVEGEFVGRLEGFRFLQDKNATGTEAKTLKAASLQALMPYFNLRADRFYNAPDTELDFTDQGGLMWGEHAVGKLEPGDDPLKPQIRAFVDDTAGQDVMQKVQRRLQHFIDRKIASLFEPLMLLQRDEALNGLARGFAFRMVEGFGILPRPSVVDDVKALDQDARGMLRKHGVRFGQFTIFMPLLLKPAATRLRILLWSLACKLDEFPISPPPGLVTIPVDTYAPAGYDIMAGYRNSNTRAIRIDMLERLADMIRVEDTRAGFEAKPDMLSITGMTLEQFSDLLQGLGYNAEKLERDKVKLTKPGIEPVEKIETSTEAGDLASKGPSYNSDLQTSEAEIASDPVVDWSLGDQFSEETSADTQSADREVVNAEALNLAENPAPVEKETYFVFTWSTRNKPKQNSLQRDFRKSDDQGNTKSRPKGKRMQHKDGLKPKTHQSKPEKTKKIDPDNPFAEALMGLKTRN
jgi:ATP-dependent RNA helicase SUPV3L1/SUV3